MGTKAYLTRTSLSYRVVVFSFRHEEPIDISPFVIGLNGSRSVTGSTQNTFTVTMKNPEISLLFQNGDWVQIDLEMPQYPSEHLFFGQIMSITGSETVAGAGSGVAEQAVFQVLHWGSVFDRFMRDLETYLRVNADTLFPWREKIEQSPTEGGELKFENLDPVAYDTPPNLAEIAQGKLKAHPWQAVSIVLHHLCRYGGALGQQFWLPTSYTGLTELVPLIDYVCRVNKTRLPTDGVMGSSWQGFDSDANNTIVQIEKRDVEGGVFKTNVPEDDRGWPYSDWHNTFERNKAFVPGQGFMRDFVSGNQLTFGRQTTLSDLALDLSDSAFNELTYTLQEHCNLGPQNPSEAIVPGTGDRVPFSRDFMMTVVLRPIPHPSWDTPGNTIIAQGEGGDLMYTASRANYEKLCIKFVLGLGHTSGVQFHQTAGNAFSYFNVVPQDQALKGFEDWDASNMIKATSGRVPIIDEDLMQTFGHMPMVLQTRYFIGGDSYYVSPSVGAEPDVKVDSVLELPKATGPGSVVWKRDETPQWKILASKALALYAWHGKGWEHYDGAFSTPIIDTNVPRPGDVGYLVSHDADTGSHFRHANRRWFEPKIVAKQLTTGAISIYVDAVDYDIVMDSNTSTIQGTMKVHYSHGVWCETVNRPNGEALPYKRFVDYSEVGIDPVYFLPPAPGAVSMQDELFSEFAQLTPVKVKELIQEIEGDKDQTRNKERRKRARRRRRKKGLRKTQPKNTGGGNKGVTFTLTKYTDYEPPEQTKKTRKNPAKKAEAPKTHKLVTRMVEVETEDTMIDVLTAGLIFKDVGTAKAAIINKKKLVPVSYPVRTNKMGEVTKEEADKTFSAFDKTPESKKDPGLKD
jgi:hypothetical protein